MRRMRYSGDSSEPVGVVALESEPEDIAKSDEVRGEVQI